jgi:hypothetical protein
MPSERRKPPRSPERIPSTPIVTTRRDTVLMTSARRVTACRDRAVRMIAATAA